jgi:hypothetical protein
MITIIMIVVLVVWGLWSPTCIDATLCTNAPFANYIAIQDSVDQAGAFSVCSQFGYTLVSYTDLLSTGGGVAMWVFSCFGGSGMHAFMVCS